MNQVERFRETIAAYRKHGWQLRRILVCEKTRIDLAISEGTCFEDIEPEVKAVDALWFARPSHAGREAWELRLIGETPYALFESFDIDSGDELREKALSEMEVRMIEYAAQN